MVPEEVFHYTKNCSTIKILSDNRIRLSQFKDTNDPRESREWRILYEYLGVPPSTNKAIKQYDENTKWLSNEINIVRLKEWKVLCVSTNHPRQKKSDNPFYLGNCRPNMWAHYGENHKGVCLKLNGRKLNRRIWELKKEKGCDIFFWKSKI